MATISFRTTLRTARAQAIITDAGATGAKVKLYNGTQPANAAAALSGNTLLATLTWAAAPIGTATSGTLDWDEASMSQSNGSHVSGTPTFLDVTTSADAVVARIPLGAGGFTWTGAVATGQNVTLTTLLFTEGNA